jgi:hypothetical protein
MKCWKSAFNSEGSRLIIIALQVGAVKVYAATVEALKKKERQGETEFTTKTEHPHPPPPHPPPVNANAFFIYL